MTLGTATVLHEKHPPWSFNGASLDLDFANGRGWVAPGRNALRDLLTVTRASVGYAEYESGAWLPSASGVARITDKGLLVEEARTNEIRNNSMQGAAAGTPGTLPTNWASAATGLTQTIVGTGTENGIEYTDIRYNGTTGSTSAVVAFDGNTQIAALTGETWTESAFISVVGGDLTNVSTVFLNVAERTAAGALVQADNGTDISGSLTSSLQRFDDVFTLSGGGTVAYITPRLGISYSSGVAVDFTLRIGWPQLEEGAFVTSPIRTTTAAATRAADVISRTETLGAAFAYYAEAVTASGTLAGTNQVLIQHGPASDRNIVIRTGSGGIIQPSSISGSVSQASFNLTGAYADETALKVAFTGAANDFAGVINGGAVSTDVSGSVPATGAVTFYVGNNGANNWNGYIRRVAYWPSRLTNAQLQTITS